MRELLRAGVPYGSVATLYIIAKKCNGDAQFVLEKVHPRLMQNILAVDGELRIRDKRYGWERRKDWVKNK